MCTNWLKISSNSLEAILKNLNMLCSKINRAKMVYNSSNVQGTKLTYAESEDSNLLNQKPGHSVGFVTVLLI